jgi:hypothetical protein
MLKFGLKSGLNVLFISAIAFSAGVVLLGSPNLYRHDQVSHL